MIPLIQKPAKSPARDRRQHTRYGFSTTLRFRPAVGNSFPWKSGRMLNMSASGILIGGSEKLLPGSRLELLADWPGFFHGAGHVRLLVLGEVVRCEDAAIALRILHHEFQALEGRARKTPAATAA